MKSQHVLRGAGAGVGRDEEEVCAVLMARRGGRWMSRLQ